MAGGCPLKPGFGLSGDVHTSQTSPANKLDCPHAMGTNAFSPRRASGAEARTRFRRLDGTNKFVPFPSPFRPIDPRILRLGQFGFLSRPCGLRLLRRGCNHDYAYQNQERPHDCPRAERLPAQSIAE